LPSNNYHQPAIILPSIRCLPTPSTQKDGKVDLSSHKQMASPDVEDVVCSPEILQKMRGEYLLFAESALRATTSQDREISRQHKNEATSLLTEEHPSHQTNTNMSSKRSSFQEELNAASLVSLLSSQMGEFEQLLIKNEAAQEKIHQLQQGSDWLKQTCESLQQSEREKKIKIDMLEKKICDLEKLVIDMKLNEAESRGREDHYKLQIANLEHLLKTGMQPCRQRDGSAKLTQSFTLSASNVRSGEHPKRNPLLTRSFSSFFRKSSVGDGTDRNCVETSKKVPLQDDEKIATNVSRPRLGTANEIISESFRRHSPKGPYDASPLHESFHSHPNPRRNDSSAHFRSNSYPIVIPERRSTHLSNITDLTDESWAEMRADEADRSCTSHPSLDHSEVTPSPVFEPAGPQLQLKMSLRSSGTTQRKEEESRGDGIPSKIDLSYC